ncbi:MAG: hypothetical protein J7K68_06105 [Candidatus Diapherotrites archaeon]|nr:hypothetical protein [Candidatus Diapherotrites archaeon]
MPALEEAFKIRRRLYAVASGIHTHEVEEAVRELYNKHKRPVSIMEIHEHVVNKRVENAIPEVAEQLGIPEDKIRQYELFETDKRMLRTKINEILNKLRKKGQLEVYVVKDLPEDISSKIIEETIRLGYNERFGSARFLKAYKPTEP